MSLVVFTDLDGTLLDHESYDYSSALPAVAELRRRRIPLVLCSSKTAAEMRPLWRDLGLADPFVVENGGGIYVPVDYFPEWRGDVFRNGFWVRSLGIPLDELRRQLSALGEKCGVKVDPVTDWSASRFARVCGLTPDQARLALDREFDLPFLLEPSASPECLLREARKRSLQIHRGGRFFHITGALDKGRAVSELKQLFLRFREPPLRFVALGDSENDLSMLQEADVAVVVPNPSSQSPLASLLPHARQAPEPGPRGWSRALLQLLAETDGG